MNGNYTLMWLPPVNFFPLDIEKEEAQGILVCDCKQLYILVTSREVRE